ncbi:MAG: hypothetical protein AAFZ52_19350, partial [Bacteroidota bacterium]
MVLAVAKPVLANRQPRIANQKRLAGAPTPNEPHRKRPSRPSSQIKREDKQRPIYMVFAERGARLEPGNHQPQFSTSFLTHPTS